MLDGFFIPLRGSLDGLLPTPARLTQQSAHVISVRADSEGAVDHLSHPARGLHLLAKALHFGSFGLQRWNLHCDLSDTSLVVAYQRLDT
jgi:hypothetical protein